MTRNRRDTPTLHFPSRNQPGKIRIEPLSAGRGFVKLKQIVLGIAAVVVIGVGYGAYYLLSNLDSIVKSAIEQYGSEITGTRVRVGSVKIALTEGRGTIRGLRVGNPSGFSSNDAFSLGEITLDLDPGSITKSPIVVETLTIAAPQVRYEMAANAKSNFDAILANIKKYQGSSGGQPAAEESGGEPLKLKVQKFTFQDGEVDIDVTALAGAGKATSVMLPALTMKNLGGKSGAPPADIGAEVMRKYSEKIVAAVAKQQLQSRAGKLLEDQGEVGSAAKKLLDSVFK